MALNSVLSADKIALALLIQSSIVNCWFFSSIYSTNNKLLGEGDGEEGVYPIPYEAPEDNEINEDNPPEPPRERIIMTWPGTKWCGPGNIAFNYHDLGIYNQTDKCCRAHDLCSDIIPAGHTAHGLNNDDFYTKLNCKCDEKFHMCLHKSKDGLGDNIGILYFNIIGTQCFRKDFPIVKCIKTRGLLRPKCVEYELDHSKPKLYQWFDVPPFK